MALRNMLLVLPCMAVVGTGTSLCAEDEQVISDQAQEECITCADDRVGEASTPLEALYERLDESDQKKIEELQADIEGVMNQLNNVCFEIGRRHAYAIKMIKDELGVDFIPIDISLGITDDVDRFEDQEQALDSCEDDAMYDSSSCEGEELQEIIE